MQILGTYIGIEPFTVLVNDSPELRALVERAKELRSLPFPERLEAVKRLVLEAMVNAYEGMHQPRTRVEKYELLNRGSTTQTIIMGQDNSAEIARLKEIVDENHPLSHALQQKAGCCRYQSALFFVLGYEANLGDKHFVQTAPINAEYLTILPIDKVTKTVFNELLQNGQRFTISIFRESVVDPRFDYTRRNPNLFEQPFKELPGQTFYSYHRTPSGLILVSNPNRHVESLEGAIK
ncbi:hypothetical protein HYX02_05600 [Candidatus Woesearchaeota archaeon]|nr:hypothetical protein [Candidatus Woesearchaeota archaeon]